MSLARWAAIGALAFAPAAYAQSLPTAAEGPASAPPADLPAADLPPKVLPWTAETYGGWAARAGGSDGAFGLVGLNRQIGPAYIRASLTDYRSTLRQTDTALPSTYVVGSLGAGANLANWVFDGWASYGWQHYGQIAQFGTTRTSPAGAGSPYYAAGADFGRIFTLRPNWYLTPTLAASYAYARLLRPGYQANGHADFQSSEPTWTGSTTLRLDHALGPDSQHLIGVALSYHRTNDGLSTLIANPLRGAAPIVVHDADGWEEGALNAAFRLNHRLTLDATASHAVGMRAGDTTAVSAGLRLQF